MTSQAPKEPPAGPARPVLTSTRVGIETSGLGALDAPLALQITAAYVLFVVLWIALADRPVGDFLQNQWPTHYQTIRGFLFAVVSSGVVFGAAAVALRRPRRAVAGSRAVALAVQQAGEAVLVTDPGGRIQYVNPAFEAITGFSRAEALGANPRILKSGEHDDAFYELMWSRLVAGESFTGTFINRRRDGTRYYAEGVISPIRARNGRIVSYVGLHRDVSDVHALQAQLRHAQRFEVLGELTGGIAHDFNNILGIVQTNAELLATELAESGDSDHCAMVKGLQEAARRGRTLVRRLLTFARRDRLALAVFHPGALVQEFEGMLRSVLPETVDFEITIGDEVPPVRGDGGALEQVLLNLVTNARDAMPEGGLLSIGVSGREMDRPRDGRVWPSHGRYACITIQDSGTGMEPSSMSTGRRCTRTSDSIGRRAPPSTRC